MAYDEESNLLLGHQTKVKIIQDAGVCTKVVITMNATGRKDAAVRIES